MPARFLRLFSLFVLAAAACSTRAEAPGGDTAPVSTDAGAADDAAHAVPDDASSCPGSPLRAYDETPGVLMQIYVDVAGDDGKSAPFLFDTGSAMSFRSKTSGTDAGVGGLVPDAGQATFSCMTTSLPGLTDDVLSTTPDGLTIGGVLGADLLARGAVLDLRIADSVFEWLRAPPAAPTGSVTLPISFSTSKDPYAENTLVTTGVKLDGKDVRLLVDTGSPHVLIMSKTPRPNETVVQTEDGTGAPVTLYTSTIAIAFGDGPPRTVAVDRAESFPTLEKTFQAIGGGEIAGILGLDALGHERIVIGKDAMTFVP